MRDMRLISNKFIERFTDMRPLCVLTAIVMNFSCQHTSEESSIPFKKLNPRFDAYIPAQTLIMPCVNIAAKSPPSQPDKESLCSSVQKSIEATFKTQAFMAAFPSQAIVSHLTSKGKPVSFFDVFNLWDLQNSSYGGDSALLDYLYLHYIDKVKDSIAWQKYSDELSSLTNYSDAILLTFAYESTVVDSANKGLLESSVDSRIAVFLIDLNSNAVIWKNEVKDVAKILSTEGGQAVASTLPESIKLIEPKLNASFWHQYPGYVLQ